MTDKSTTLQERFGQIPKEAGLTRKMRVHQGWWRTNVLNEEPGLHPIIPTQNVCSAILNGDTNGKNFLTANAIKSVRETLAKRTKENMGIIEEDRLFNNLLSSQPLCFNFFGELYADQDFGLLVLKTYYPDLTKLVSVNFEFAPTINYTNDRSAFDIAFEVEAGDKKGLIGFECKYTDTFSFKPSKSPIFYGDEGNKNYDAYLSIYNKSIASFTKPYFDFVRSKDFNQLFRNQLISEALLQDNIYDFVRTGLFCYQDDDSATETAKTFKTMLSNPDNFQLIKYSDFISKVQRLELTWQQREWTMLLWARYCGTALSNDTTVKLNGH
jgi:hypothetical protein